jgi:hypothetical protein
VSADRALNRSSGVAAIIEHGDADADADGATTHKDILFFQGKWLCTTKTG